MSRAIRGLALLAVVGLVAAACGGSTGGSGGSKCPSGKSCVGMVYDLAGRGDHSFNDSAYTGLQKAGQDFSQITVKDLTPVASGANRQALMRLLAQQGYGLIFGNGFAFADDLAKVAKDFPDIKFACTDCGIPNLTESSNIVNNDFAANEGSFLVGAAAAMKSKTGKVGFIGGVDTTLIHQFQAGYEAGAKYVKPGITVDIKYLTTPPDFSGFSDPAKGKEAALGLFQGGDDVVYHAAGGSGGGLFAAAKEYSAANNTHVWAIGVDSDQYQTAPADQQPFILTSMIKRVDVSVYDTIKAFLSNSFKGGTALFGLKDGAIDYSTTGGFVDDIKSKLDDLKQKIISGEIKVPLPTS
ncbi:MAG: BMP family ABC transporter substrate-binding protein [Actinobacteria bacterium]|nr:MAG: BMP family ABC transporter substrate-binding protein [Actinomycetota bacterium]